jgi:exosortase/archaeosortase family protein
MKKEQKSTKELGLIVLRYLFLLLIALFLAYSTIFYRIFLILTIYPVSSLLNIFYESFVYNSLILIEGMTIEIIPACVAVSAYFLLLILNFTTPMTIKQRIKTLVFSFLALLVLNILRIFILSVLLVEEYAYFDIVHKIFWYSLSLIFVAGVWFLSVFLFGVKNIPVYTDFKLIFDMIRGSKKKS